MTPTETTSEMVESWDWVITRDVNRAVAGIRNEERRKAYRAFFKHVLEADKDDALRQCETEDERRRTALRYIRGLSA